jgi:hypothetical protein
VKISNKKIFFFASETNTFHILYVESKKANIIDDVMNFNLMEFLSMFGISERRNVGDV